MKKSISRVISLLLVFAMLFAFGACGSDENDDATTEPTTTLSDQADATTQANNQDTSSTSTTVDEVDTSETQTSKNPLETEVKLPQGKAEILAAYTDVMNFAKTSKPAYEKVEYQVLPEKERKIDSGIVDRLLGLASKFMTTREEAMEKPQVSDKNSNMRWFPVYKSDKGCLLTDTSAIKEAKCEKLSNGSFKITILLKEEMNPEPYDENTKRCSSYTGKMFGPLAKAEIDKEIDGIPVIKKADYSLKYYNCKAVLVYNPVNKHIVTLDQFMSTLITLSGKIFLLPEFSGTAVLNNTMNIYDVKY